MSIDQQFNTINEKLQQLLRQYSRLERENERLRVELEEARQQEKEWKGRVEEQQQQIMILKLGAGEMSDRDKKEFEKKINQYIREIDKCIAYLSQ